MRPFVDEGHQVVAQKPLRISARVYRHDKLPCPVQHTGCVILVNNRHDDSHMRLAFSNGASWVFFVRDGEVPSQAVTVRPAEIDLTPLVKAAVEAALPGMLPPQVKVVEHVREQALPDLAQLDKLREDIRMLATTNLEISAHLDPIAQKLDDLMSRVEFIEHHALAKAELEQADG
jgi:hypothetical protein